MSKIKKSILIKSVGEVVNQQDHLRHTSKSVNGFKYLRNNMVACIMLRMDTTSLETAKCSRKQARKCSEQLRSQYQKPENNLTGQWRSQAVRAATSHNGHRELMSKKIQASENINPMKYLLEIQK